LTFLKKKNKVIDFKTVIVFSLKIKKNKNCYCVYLVFIVFVFSFSRKKLEIFHGQYTYMIHNPFVIKKLKFLRWGFFLFERFGFVVVCPQVLYVIKFICSYKKYFNLKKSVKAQVVCQLKGRMVQFFDK